MILTWVHGVVTKNEGHWSMGPRTKAIVALDSSMPGMVPASGAERINTLSTADAHLEEQVGEMGQASVNDIGWQWDGQGTKGKGAVNSGWMVQKDFSLEGKVGLASPPRTGALTDMMVPHPDPASSPGASMPLMLWLLAANCSQLPLLQRLALCPRTCPVQEFTQLSSPQGQPAASGWHSEGYAATHIPSYHLLLAWHLQGRFPLLAYEDYQNLVQRRRRKEENGRILCVLLGLVLWQPHTETTLELLSPKSCQGQSMHTSCWGSRIGGGCLGS